MSIASSLERARRARSQRKRRAVENAIGALRREGVPISFLAVAKRAEVSRTYLYANFRTEIGGERAAGRNDKAVIDGKVVPLRSMPQYRQIEAALRSKIERLEGESKSLRSQLRAATDALERERGLVEYWREQYEGALLQPGARR
jgi:hypothetical protein